MGGHCHSLKKGTVLLRIVVKVEDVEDPIAVGESMLLTSHLRVVEEIIVRTPLAMLALSEVGF